MIKQARFSNKTKKEIIERDGGICILCGSHDLSSPHHAWFGHEAQYDEGRNNADRGVCICVLCHEKIHHKSGGKIKRQQCKNYLKNYYETTRKTKKNFPMLDRLW